MSEIDSSPTEVAAQVEATASDWRFVASRAESGKSRDFQSQLATSRVAATLLRRDGGALHWQVCLPLSLRKDRSDGLFLYHARSSCSFPEKDRKILHGQAFPFPSPTSNIPLPLSTRFRLVHRASSCTPHCTLPFSLCLPPQCTFTHFSHIESPCFTWYEEVSSAPLCCPCRMAVP